VRRSRARWRYRGKESRCKRRFLDTGIVQKDMNAQYGGSPQTYASASRITVGTCFGFPCFY
jgi:hypothetical protein